MLKMYYVMFVRNHNEDINIITDYPETYKHTEGFLTVIRIKDVLCGSNSHVKILPFNNVTIF